MLFNFIGWCLFGLIAGAIAKLLTGGNHPSGCIATTGIGVAGSFAMGAIFHVLFASSNEGLQPAGFVGSVIGAILVLITIRRMQTNNKIQ